MPTITLIIAAVDFSPGSEAAAIYAVWLAGRLGARVRLVHAFTGLPHASAGVAPDLRDDLVAAEEELRREAERNLAELAARLAGLAGGAGQPLETAVVPAHEAVADAILRAAGDAGADLIVMGSHGRSGIRRMLLGSVAERVTRAAGCPVLIVR